MACLVFAAPASASGFATVWETLTLQAYNTRVVVLSVTVLGFAAGLVGAFLLLRKQSLMGDALSHATLPGIALAFLVMVSLGGDGKALPGLLAGAAVTGVLGVACVAVITRATRLKDDAAMGVVLSVFFGAGIALLTVVQRLPEGSAAGLSSFIYGKTASMTAADRAMILWTAAAVAGVTVLLLKELTLLCFDDAFAAAQGWPVGLLDAAMIGLVAAVTVVGLQAVGLILILAFLITPAAAARFWTDDLKSMLWLSGVIGAGSGWLGASLSAVYADLPAGAVIVCAASAVFVVSLLVGRERGVVVRAARQWRLKRTVQRQHLLRALYECMESAAHAASPSADPDARHRAVAIAVLRAARPWKAGALRQKLKAAERDGLIRPRTDGEVVVTDAGFYEAARVTRNHRLWETFLVTHADVAPSQVDRDADRVEHVLSAELIRQLEAVLRQELRDVPMPASPHAIGGGR